MSTPKNLPATAGATDEAAARDLAKVVESLVLRGDISGLGPAERARYYMQMCEGLGLNPNSHPFAFLRLNGKEILYAGKGATDQLAFIHKINRRIIEGPKVIDLAGTKLVYAVCEAKHPNGRVETSTATVPLVDPVNVLMKVETKAKRRATLSILGLGLLDEMELETIPASAQEPGGSVDLTQGHTGNHFEEVTADAPTAETPAEVPAALEGFYLRVSEIELPGEAVAVWIKHRTDLAALPASDREAAWKALCAKTEDVGKMKNAKVWLKKAIAEEDSRMGRHDDPPPGGGAGGGSSKRRAPASGDGTSAANDATHADPRALDAAAFRAHVARVPHHPAGTPEHRAELSHIAMSYLTRSRKGDLIDDDACRDEVRDELRARGCGDPDAFIEGVALNAWGPRGARKLRAA